MKTGLGLYRKFRNLIAYFNLFRFSLRKYLIGFDYANQFIQRVDKYSLQIILKKNGATIGENCDIESGLTFHNCKDYSNLHIGNSCHIGKNCFFDLRGSIIIYNNSTISMGVTILTHSDFGYSSLMKIYPQSIENVVIGNDVFIGANSTILAGVTIGDFNLIAASSLVNKSSKPNSVLAGVPATIKGSITTLPTNNN